MRLQHNSEEDLFDDVRKSERLAWQHIKQLLHFLVVLSSLILTSTTSANGLFEASVGPTMPIGSELESSPTIGSQVLLGWGGKLPWMAEGSASYLYASLDYDLISQQGPNFLGSPQIDRQQWTPHAGIRTFSLLAEQVRLWWDIGFGMTYDSSTVVLKSLGSRTSYHGESSSIGLGAGIQYKLSAGLLLSVGYETLFYFSKKSLAYPEKAFLQSSDASLSGRGRLNIGIGFYL